LPTGANTHRRYAWRQVVEVGPAEQVLHQPKNAYTRELLAAIPELH
jgi:ABC-type dipeptide/oligopeptide/nickel transport system ATPase component